MMMSRRALLAALVLCPMALQAQAGPGEQEAGTVNAGTTRLELVALDDGHVRAHVVGPREIATMTWSGGELRAWIDTARTLLANGSPARPASTPQSGQLVLLRVPGETGTSFGLRFAVGGGWTETLNPTNLRNLLRMLDSADDMMRRMTPAERLATATRPVTVDLELEKKRVGRQEEAGPYFEFQVDKPVTLLPGSGGIEYPARLRAANVQGEVLAQFVIDADGRYVPGTFRVLKSDDALLSAAVRDAIPGLRFRPAELGGRKVSQLVQQPFTFSLSAP
jgi:TonB family protein